jgi:hypothetical protein
MIGQWMAAGFVHGVMNTDNFNITGETFDFGPWRFMAQSDPNFTAAYFDQQGLYRFGRQPVQGGWALAAAGLGAAAACRTPTISQGRSCPMRRPIATASATTRMRSCSASLPTGDKLPSDLGFLQAFYGWMTQSGAGWAQTFFDWFGGEASSQRAAASPQAHQYAVAAFGSRPHRPERARPRPPGPPRCLLLPGCLAPVSLVIEDVEALWAPIAAEDDWSAFAAKTAHIEAARQALL